MESIRNLYYKEKAENKIHYFDYPIADSKPATYKVNSGKPFKVGHADGTVSLAYGFGEKQFTYDYTELVQAKKDYQDRRAWLKVHNELIAKLNTLDNEILADIVKEFCENA